MDWHQPWLMAMLPHELENLHSDCREREKAHAGRGRFGLARAWAGLAHEVVERMLELERETNELNPTIDQLVVDDAAYRRGAYDDPEAWGGVLPV